MFSLPELFRVDSFLLVFHLLLIHFSSNTRLLTFESSYSLYCGIVTSTTIIMVIVASNILDHTALQNTSLSLHNVNSSIVLINKTFIAFLPTTKLQKTAFHSQLLIFQGCQRFKRGREWGCELTFA